MPRRCNVPPIRSRLGNAGIECLEADLRFAYRYLIDRGIRGGFTVDGPFERRPGIGRVYRNPTLAPAEDAVYQAGRQQLEQQEVSGANGAAVRQAQGAGIED